MDITIGFFACDIIMMSRFIQWTKKLSLKYIHRECVSGVKRASCLDNMVGFMIEQIGPDLENGNCDTIFAAIPAWFESFTDIEIWVHEFVEHTLGNRLFQIFISKRILFGEMPYAVTMKHFVTCLSTFSVVSNGLQYWHITPDEYVKIIKLTELDLCDRA